MGNPSQSQQRSSGTGRSGISQKRRGQSLEAFETLTSAMGTSWISPFTQETGRILVPWRVQPRMLGCTRVTVLPELRRAETDLLFTLTMMVGALRGLSTGSAHPASQGLKGHSVMGGSGSVGMGSSRGVP